eukprot:3533543-Prorocentrum_lima.AAC.1
MRHEHTSSRRTVLVRVRTRATHDVSRSHLNSISIYVRVCAFVSRNVVRRARCHYAQRNPGQGAMPKRGAQARHTP